MKSTWSGDFPRLFDLYCESDQNDLANYFAAFGEELKNPLARQHYEKLEEELGQLDGVAWQALKEKVLSYVNKRDCNRGYSQLFDFFNEAKGYLYLKSEGCTEVHFIDEEKTPTPDLYGRCGDSVFLMEVKTINKSDDERNWIQANSERRNGHMSAREAHSGLDDLLKDKVRKTISVAKGKFRNYICNGVTRRIVYLVIDPDILVALDSRNIDELTVFMEEQSDEQIEVKHCYYNY